MAILDQIGCRGYRFHRGSRVHVHPVQGIPPPLQEVEGLQQDHSGAGAEQRGLKINTMLNIFHRTYKCYMKICFLLSSQEERFRFQILHKMSKMIDHLKEFSLNCCGHLPQSF